MKKIIILFVGLCFFTKTYSQDYTPMLEISKTWNYYLSFTGGGYYFDLTDSEIVDIDGVEYHHIEASHNDCEIFLREDISEKKVYGIWEGEEYVMYDFSADIGDFLWLNGEFVLIIDIGYGDFYGMENLRYYLLENSEKLIEGIGVEQNGLTDAFEYGCLTQDPWYEIIQLINMNHPLSVSAIRLDNISIFPNPVSDVLQIENNDKFELKDVKIYSILGELVLSPQLETERNLLDLSCLNDGTFFMKIETNSGFLTKKLIKISN